MTRVLKRLDELSSRISGEGHVTVVMDPALWDGPVRERLESLPACRDAEWLALPDGQDGLEPARIIAERVVDGGWCLAVGGGTTIDAVKVARSLPWSEVLLGSGGASILLDVGIRGRWGMAALPTTVGTASEVSSVAVIRLGSSRSLCRGPVLRPDLACIDPVLTESLPPPLVAEGIVEALLRAVMPYIGDPLDMGRDTLVHAVARRLIRHLHALADGPLGPEARRDVAELSECSQTRTLHANRNPHAHRLWPVNHEVADAVGLSKTRAMSALAPQVMNEIATGASAWGSVDAVHGLTEAVSDLLPTAEDHAGVGGRWRALMVRNGLPAALPLFDVNAVTGMVMDRWGAPQPHLGALCHDDVSRLLAAVVQKEKER